MPLFRYHIEGGNCKKIALRSHTGGSGMEIQQCLCRGLEIYSHHLNQESYNCLYLQHQCILTHSSVRVPVSSALRSTYPYMDTHELHTIKNKIKQVKDSCKENMRIKRNWSILLRGLNNKGKRGTVNNTQEAKSVQIKLLLASLACYQ